MNTERQKEILKILYKKRKVTVSELSSLLYTSEPSIRRDLAVLEKQRLLKRFYGGAMIEANGISPIKVPYLMRELEKVEEKELIAEKAVSMLKDTDLVFLDSSSSALTLLPYLAEKKDITVVTNGIKILAKAIDYPGLRIISTGGTLFRSGFSLYGDETFKSIKNYYANAVFFSCGGFDDLGMISDFNQEENLVRRAMIAQSNNAYLLCTSEKIGVRKFHHLCDAREINGIICTKPLRDNLKDMQILATESNES